MQHAAKRLLLPHLESPSHAEQRKDVDLFAQLSAAEASLDPSVDFENAAQSLVDAFCSLLPLKACLLFVRRTSGERYGWTFTKTRGVTGGSPQLRHEDAKCDAVSKPVTLQFAEDAHATMMLIFGEQAVSLSLPVRERFARSLVRQYEKRILVLPRFSRHLVYAARTAAG